VVLRLLRPRYVRVHRATLSHVRPDRRLTKNRRTDSEKAGGSAQARQSRAQHGNQYLADAVRRDHHRGIPGAQPDDQGPLCGHGVRRTARPVLPGIRQPDGPGGAYRDNDRAVAAPARGVPRRYGPCYRRDPERHRVLAEGAGAEAGKIFADFRSERLFPSVSSWNSSRA